MPTRWVQFPFQPVALSHSLSPPARNCQELPGAAGSCQELPGAVGHVLWLPLFLDGWRGSSLRRCSGRAEGRRRRKSRAKWPEAPGRRGSNPEYPRGKDLPSSWPLSHTPSCQGPGWSNRTAAAPQPLPACLAVCCLMQAPEAPGPVPLSSHATSCALPPFSSLAGLFFSPLPPLSLLSSPQPGLPATQSSGSFQPPPRLCRATKGPWLRCTDPTPLLKLLLLPALHSYHTLHSQTRLSRLSQV